MQSLLTAHAIPARRYLVTFELLASLLLLGAAVAVRLPHFMTVPVISDESREVLWGLDIARGIHFPFTSVDAYDGPLFPYLMAVAFRVFGVSPELPRLVVLVLNALAVVATYWLGITWAKRITDSVLIQQLAGSIAAIFMLTSSVQIFVNSHLAWSNSTTPFFTTVSIIALTFALQRGSMRRWSVAGALYGLALQTHPSVIMLAPAVLLWIILDSAGRAQLTTRMPAWGAVAALISYSPVIIYNFLSWGSAQASIDTAARRTYAFGLPESASDYVARLVMHSIELLRALASNFETYERAADYLRSPLVVGYLLLLIAALLFLARRGNLLPALAVGSTLILLAVFDKRTNFPYDTRYFAFLLPLIFAAFGMLGAFVLRALWTWTPQYLRGTRGELRFGSLPSLPVLLAVRVLLTALLVVNFMRLALFPLYILVGVNQFFLVNGPNSSGMIELAQRARAANAFVWLDQDLTGADYWMCNGVTAGEALAYLLTLNSVPEKTFKIDQFAVTPTQWIAVTPQHSAQLSARTKMKPIATTMPPGVHCAPAVIEMYEVEN